MRSKKFMFIKQNILLLFFITFILFFNKSYAQECIDLAQGGQRKLAIQAVASQLYLNNLVIKFDETKKRYLYLPQEMKSLTDAIEAGLWDLSKDVKLAIQTEQKLIEEADDVLEYQYSLNEQTASAIDIMLSAPLKQRDIDLDLDFLDDKARDEVRATLNKYNIDFNPISEYYTNEIDGLLGYVPGDPYATKSVLIISQEWAKRLAGTYSTRWHPGGDYVVITGYYTDSGPYQNPQLSIYKFYSTSLGPAINPSPPVGGTGEYRSIDWSLGGRYLVAGGSKNDPGDGYSIRVFEFDEGMPSVMGVTKAMYDTGVYDVRSVAWHTGFGDTSGGFFAVVGDGDDAVDEIQIYEITGLPTPPDPLGVPFCKEKWGTGENKVYGCAWSSDGKYLAVAGERNNEGKVLRVFKFDPNSSDPEKRLIECASMNYDDFDFDVGWITCVDWSSNGKYLALSSNTFITEYSGETPQIAMNAGSNGFTVWKNTSNVIQALRYDILIDSWEKEIVALSSSAYDCSEPQVAMNNNGDAIAVWRKNDGDGNGTVQANRYDASTGSWQSPSAVANLSLFAQNASLPQVVMDDKGGAIAVWQRPTGTTGEIVIQANMYDGVSWQDPSDVTNLSDVHEESTKPQIVMNDEGDAIVVWRNFDGGDEYSIQACKYDHKSCDWLSIVNVTSSLLSTYTLDNPQVGMSNDVAIIVWEGEERTGTFLFDDVLTSSISYIAQARVNVIQKGWEQQEAWDPSLNKEPEDLSLSKDIRIPDKYIVTTKAKPQIAITDYEGIAAWMYILSPLPPDPDQRIPDEPRTIIQAKKYILGQGWQLTKDLTSVNPSFPYYYDIDPQIAMDGTGNAIVVWWDSILGDFLGAKRYKVVTDSWEYQNLSSFASGGLAQVAMDRPGNAIVIWQGPSNKIYASKYYETSDLWKNNLGVRLMRCSLKVVKFNVTPETLLNFFTAWNDVQKMDWEFGVMTAKWASSGEAVAISSEIVQLAELGNYTLLIFGVDFESEILTLVEGDSGARSVKRNLPNITNRSVPPVFPYDLAWHPDHKYISAANFWYGTLDIYNLDYDYFGITVDTYDTSVPTRSEVKWSNKGGRDIDILSNILGQNQEKNGTKSMPVKFSIPGGYTGAAHFDPHINPACTSADDGLTGILDASIEVTDSLLGARKRNCKFMQDNLKLSKRMTDVFKKSIEIKKTEKARVIDRPGVYTLNKDLHGVIQIDADNIILDLNGCKIFSDSKIPITVNKNRKNIVIKNGSIIGGNQYLGASSGVLVQEGAQHITLGNLTITFCYEGMTFKGEQDCSVTDCLVEDCAFKSNIKAAQLDCAESVTFKGCEFLDCFLENVNLENNNKNCCQ